MADVSLILRLTPTSVAASLAFPVSVITQRTAAPLICFAHAEYKAIELVLGRALSADEAGHAEEALALYNEAELRIHRLTDRLRTGHDWSLLEKLDAFMSNVLSRQEALQKTIDSRSDESYASAPPLPACSAPNTSYEQLMCLSKPEVQMYTVSAEGQVSIPSYPCQLEINFLSGPHGQPFIQLGEWRCPLVPGETPLLLTGDDLCTLMMPDPRSLRPGDSVALLLPRDLHPYERSALLQVLSRLGRLMVSDPAGVRPLTEAELGSPLHSQPPTRPPPPPPEPSASNGPPEGTPTHTKVASGIAATTAFLALGLQWGAQKGSNLVHRGSQMLRDRLERPGQADRPVDPRIESGAATARQGSHYVVKSTEVAVSVVAAAVKIAANYAAPHVCRRAEKLLPNSWMAAPANGGASKADKALSVASAAVGGLSTIYLALEKSAKILGRSVASGTADVVGARYGDRTGAITEDVLYSIGNVGLTVHNMQSLGPKGVAKTAAASTIKSCDEQRSRGGPGVNGDEKTKQSGPQK